MVLIVSFSSNHWLTLQSSLEVFTVGKCKTGFLDREFKSLTKLCRSRGGKWSA